MTEPAIRIETDDVQQVLAQSGMLVSFSRRTWSGKMIDEDASDMATSSAGARRGAVKASKNILVGNDGHLVAVVKAISAAYNDHMGMTLPWGNSEFRLLPNVRFMDYAKMLQGHKDTISALLKVFAVDYPDAVKRSMPALGSLAKAAEYPPVSEIVGRFGIDVHFEPIPVGAKFPGLPPQLGEVLQQRLRDKIVERAKAAIDVMMTQVREAVERLHNQTRPDGRIHDATVEEVMNLPGRIRAFNIVQDPKLEALAAIIKNELSFFDPKSIKGENVRKAAHETLGKVKEMLA